MLLETVNLIRKLTVIALFSDDDLMDTFVLKGGNALNIVYGINNRASKDIDVSMAEDFDQGNLSLVQQKISNALISTFEEHNIHVFDIVLKPQPLKMNIMDGDFWGGYKLQFKLIEREKANGNMSSLRKQAISLDKQHTKTFTVDISKYEFCETKEERELDGYTIYVYTPLMMIFEKLRAICQQMEDYAKYVESHYPRPRARDFYDIHSIVTQCKVKVSSPTSKYLLSNIFKAKRVPLFFLEKVCEEREFHRDNFNTVLNTVTPDSFHSYDFYFDFVLDLIKLLEPVWKE